MNSGRKWLSFFTPNPRPRIESVCFSVILLFLVRWVFNQYRFCTRSLNLVNVILGLHITWTSGSPFNETSLHPVCYTLDCCTMFQGCESDLKADEQILDCFSIF